MIYVWVDVAQEVFIFVIWLEGKIATQNLSLYRVKIYNVVIRYKGICLIFIIPFIDNLFVLLLNGTFFQRI